MQPAEIRAYLGLAAIVIVAIIFIVGPIRALGLPDPGAPDPAPEQPSPPRIVVPRSAGSGWRFAFRTWLADSLSAWGRFVRPEFVCPDPTNWRIPHTGHNHPRPEIPESERVKVYPSASVQRLPRIPDLPPHLEGGVYQCRVAAWMAETFGPEVSADYRERGFRFAEEALELLQANGTTKEDILTLLEYVYSRPVGVFAQEVGGTMLTLAALCEARGVPLALSADKELARCSEPEARAKIQAKQAEKRARMDTTPLPGLSAVPAPIMEPLPESEIVRCLNDIGRLPAGVWLLPYFADDLRHNFRVAPVFYKLPPRMELTEERVGFSRRAALQLPAPEGYVLNKLTGKVTVPDTPSPLCSKYDEARDAAHGR